MAAVVPAAAAVVEPEGLGGVKAKRAGQIGKMDSYDNFL